MDLGGADFSTIAKPLNIVITTLVAGIIAATGYWLFTKWLKGRGEIILNFVYVILSFASIPGAFAFKLPFDIEMPELFTGLVVPIHLFPPLAWFTLKPLFFKNIEPIYKTVA